MENLWVRRRCRSLALRVFDLRWICMKDASLRVLSSWGQSSSSGTAASSPAGMSTQTTAVSPRVLQTRTFTERSNAQNRNLTSFALDWCRWSSINTYNSVNVWLVNILKQLRVQVQGQASHSGAPDVDGRKLLLMLGRHVSRWKCWMRLV